MNVIREDQWEQAPYSRSNNVAQALRNWTEKSVKT